jgi:zinc protease
VYIIAVTVAWALSGLANAGSDGPLDLEVHRFNLNNGMDVWVHVDARAPLVATAMRVDLGTADEAAGLAGSPGIAHLVEHLMFTGSPAAPDGAHDRWIEAAGGETNAWTEHDATVYTTVAPANALDLILALEADRLRGFSAALSERDVEVQRAVVFEERREIEAAAGGTNMAVWQAAVFPEAHPYHWPVLGTVAELEQVDAEAVRAFVARRWLPPRLRLIVAGDVDPAVVERRARYWFSEIAAGSPVPRPEPTPVSLDAEERWLWTDPEPQLTVLWPTVARDHPDAAALDMVARLLARDGSGALWRALVAGGPRVERVDAWQWNGRLGGYLGIAVHTGDADFETVLARIDRELLRLSRTAPEVAALASIVRLRRAAWIRHLEDPVHRADALAKCGAASGTVRCLALEMAALRAVTPADIRRVVDVWLLGTGRSIVSSVPMDQLGRALTDSSPLVLP